MTKTCHNSPVRVPQELLDDLGKEMEEVLSGRFFRGKASAKRLLRFLASAKMQGRSDELTQKNISEACFKGYASEGIASTEKYRLRSYLAEYYRTEGRIRRLRLDVSANSFDVTLAAAIEPSPTLVVGRNHQLKLLKMELELASKTGPRLVWISGEAGIGKTTLVETFLSEARADARVLIASTTASEAWSGYDVYFPVLLALRDLCSGSDYRARALLQGAHKHASSWVAQMFPERGRGAPPPSLDELRTFFEEMSRKQPIILFLDDIHLADDATAKSLSAVLRKSKAKLLIAVCHRHAEFEASGNQLVELKRARCMEARDTVIRLGMLTTDDAHQYLEGRFPGNNFGSEVAAAVHFVTGGHPLFTVRLIDQLEMNGAIEKEANTSPGAWVLKVAPSTLVSFLPESVAASLDLLLSRLAKDDRDLLLAACLQGDEFESAVLSRVLKLDPEIIEARLQILMRREHLIRFSDARVLPDGTASARYRFAHSTYQRSFHAWLEREPSRMRSWALIAVQAFKEMFGQAAELDIHLATLFDAAGEPESSVPCYLRVAENAVRRFAHYSARLTCEHALGRLTAVPEGPFKDRLHLDLLFVKAVALTSTHGYGSPELKAIFTEGLAASARTSDLSDRYMALYGLWNATNHYDFEAGLKFAETMLKEIIDHPLISGANAVRATFAAGISALHAGQLSKAKNYLENAYRAVETAPLSVDIYSYQVNPKVIAACNYARVLWITGNILGARQANSRAAAFLREVPDPKSEAYALCMFAMLDAVQGRLDAGLETAEKAYDVARRYGFELEMGWSGIIRANIMASQSPCSEAERLLRDLVDRYLRMGVPVASTKFLCWVAESQLRVRDWSAARQTLERGLGYTNDANERYFEAELHRLRGRALHGEEDIQGAEVHVDKAVQISRDQGARTFELRANTTLLHIAAPGSRSACSAAKRVRTLLRDLPNFNDMPETLAAQEGLKLHNGRTPASERG